MSDPRPHVLYVAWGFPPCRAGGVYRALATANAFSRNGFRVTVLTASRESFFRYTGADASLEDRVDEAVEVVRVPFEWPSLESDLRTWTAPRVFAPALWRRWRNREDLKSFPELGYGPWRAPLEEAARAVHRENPVDLVVATANPNVDFMAAKVLHDESGVPYVMDYRDAWMLNVFDGDLLHEEGGEVDRLERELLAGAHEVWFVNEPIRAWHAERHPEVASRMHVVANGYDPEFAPDPDPSPSTAPLSFGYIGTVSPKVPLAELAEGWRRARRRGGVMAGATADIWGYLGYYSTPSPVLLGLVEEYADDGLAYRGPIPKAEVSRVYADTDVCLLVLGAGRFVTSGKVFEYLATAKPIVSVHDPGNAASEVLEGYPLWFPARSLDPEDVADALEASARAALEASPETRRACQEFSIRYARDHQLVPRVTALRDEVAGALAGGRP